MKTIIGLLAAITLVLAGCGGGGEVVNQTSTGFTVEGGVAQKGALLKGSHVWIDELNPFTYAPTGFTYDLLTKDNQGRFDSSAINFTRQHIQTFAEGYYFNEVTGQLANDSVLLQAQGDLILDRLVNVNLLTTLAGPRLVALVTDKTKPATYRNFAAARTQAQKEVLAAFWIYNSTDLMPGGLDASSKLIPANFSELDLANSQTNQAANQVLAALSALAVKGGVNGVGISQFIANFQQDLTDDGLINGSGGATSVRLLIDNAAGMSRMDYVAKNLNNFYGSSTLTTKQLLTWIDGSYGVDQVISRYKYWGHSATTNTLIKSDPYVAGSEDVGLCFSFQTGAMGSLFYNEGTTSVDSIKVAAKGDRLVMGLSSPTAGSFGGYLLKYAPVNGICPAFNTVRTVRVAKFADVFYGQTIDTGYTAASVAGTSFVSAAFPLCGASADYPVKVFFDAYNADNKGKAFIYGGTSCKSGVEAWYTDLNAGVIYMQTPNAEAVLLAKKDANTLYQTAIRYDGKGGRQVLSYGLMSIQPAYATTLYQNAYWTGTVCRLPLNTATIGMPTIPYVRSDGFPSFDSTSATGCPTGWISFNVSRHRSSDLLWEQQTADAANLGYHYQLSTGNWDFQFISSIANATKDSITNTYPNTCPTSGISSLSYMGHLTMSKDGFTAAGNACEGGVSYYQFVNGKFFTPTAYQISGTLSGLNSGASVTLTNNGADQITLSANGVFTFPTSIGASSTYLAAVNTQPTGQTCTVGNSSGTGAAHTQNISVTCNSTSPVQLIATGFTWPQDIAVDPSGNIFVADSNSVGWATDGVYKFTPPSTLGQPYTKSLYYKVANPTHMVLDSSQNMYLSAYNAGQILKIPPGGASSSVYASGLYDPEQLAFDGSNNLYVAQNWSGSVAKIAPPSGSGQPVVTKNFAKTPYFYANGLAVDPYGNIYVHSNDNNVVNSAVTKITPTGILSTYSNVKGYGDMKFDDVGNLYTTSGNGISIIDPTGKVSILDTGMTFNEPQGLAFDKEKKTLYLTTKGTSPSLYKIDLTKIIQTKNTGLLYVWYAYTNVPVAYEAWVNDSLLNEHNQANNPFWTNEIKAIDLKGSTQITTTTTPTGSKISIPRGSYVKGMKIDITVTGFVQAWATVNFNYSCSVTACTVGQAWSSTPGVNVSVALTP